jgi:hypothetical protein
MINMRLGIKIEAVTPCGNFDVETAARLSLRMK